MEDTANTQKSGARRPTSPRQKHQEKALKIVKDNRRLIDEFTSRNNGIGPSAAAINRGILLVLRAIIVTSSKANLTSIRRLAVALWSEKFEGIWANRIVNDGTRLTIDTFKSLIGGKIIRPPDWEILLEALAEKALAALELPESDFYVAEFLALLRGEAEDLEHCLVLAFNFASRDSALLRPMIDTSLGSKPFWLAQTWHRPKPTVSEKVPEIINLLQQGSQRIVYVQGDAFCAKRDVLKGVIDELMQPYLTIESGRRLPIFAQAAAAISTVLFVDRLFNFFYAREFKEPLLRDRLSAEDKIAAIRAAALRTPIMLIVSDVEPFDKNAVVRNLRGDRIGELIAAVIEGHRDSRILIGIRTCDKNLPWVDQAVLIELGPSRDEFDAAVAELGKNVRLQIEDEAGPTRNGGANLSGLTLRLALPIVEAAKGQNRLGTANHKFLQALQAPTPDKMFSLVWHEQLSPQDHFLLGLIASSHDGLLIKTLSRLIAAVETIHHRAGDDESIIKGLPRAAGNLRDWQERNRNLVRWREEVEALEPGMDDDGAFYIREPIRGLVLRAWMETAPRLARDGLWCVAREAFDQARALLVKLGSAGVELALARRLQSVHALIASVDPDELQKSDDGATPSSLALAARILPPLSVCARRPPGKLAYQFAWRQLYTQDIEGNEHQLLNARDDPNAKLDVLLPFLRPQEPWLPTSERNLCLSPDGSISLETLGPARLALDPDEQIELLTGIALAALRIGTTKCFHMVRDAAMLGRLLIQEHGANIPARVSLRLIRAEIDLGILTGGNPDAVIGEMFCRPQNEGSRDRSYQEVDYTYDGVVAHVDMLLSASFSDDTRPRTKYEEGSTRRDVYECTNHFVRGKLLERLGEIHYLRGDQKAAVAAFKRAIEEERIVSTLGPPGDAISVILGGRGARRIARFCLDRALRNRLETINFPSDGLMWPTYKPLDLHSTSLRTALLFIDINRTRVARNRWLDRIGVMVDEAFVFLVTGSYDEAQKQVDAALRVSARTTGFEALLELGVLRALVAIETAMRISDPWDGQVNQDLCNRLQRSESVAANALDSLKAMVGSRRLGHYTATIPFLAGQLDILRSRRQPPDKRASHFAEAQRNLQLALNRLQTMNCAKYLERIEATAEAVDQVISSRKLPAPSVGR